MNRSAFLTNGAAASPGNSWRAFQQRMLKRAFDLVCATLILIVLAPIMLVVALGVRLTTGSPVLFRQTRPGKNGRPFVLLKFRTMDDRTDAQNRMLPDAKRLTKIGQFLRGTSFDELPQLWNVFRGQMSLVGPRPLLMRYYPYFTEEERARFLVRPGITGLAQVKGRNDMAWDERIRLDLEYVRSYSVGLDFKILFQTVVRVLRRDGVQVDPGAVMEDFDQERRRRGIEAKSNGIVAST
jgi:lipopolysaccharide/colanic/teichoic acid biosynthesis glycosyltransferase